MGKQAPDTDARSAAVLIALRGRGRDEELLLTLRAAHMNTHRGEVALPGGRWEPGDATLADTALRETFEEVGIAPAQLRITDELPASYTGAGVRVKPYVALAEGPLNTTVNKDELEELFWLPCRFLVKDKRIRTDVFSLKGKEYWAPAYRYEQYEIWGFTARVLVQFMNQCRQAGITQPNPAPVARHRPVAHRE